MLLYQLILDEYAKLESQGNEPEAAAVALFNTLQRKRVVEFEHVQNEERTGYVWKPDLERDWLLGKSDRKLWARNCGALRWLVENYGKIVELPSGVQQALDESLGYARPQVDQSILMNRAGGLRLQVFGLDDKPRNISWLIGATIDDFRVLWTCAFASLLFPGAIGLPGYCGGCGEPLITKKKERPSAQALCNVCRKIDWNTKNEAKAAEGRTNERAERSEAKRPKRKKYPRAGT